MKTFLFSLLLLLSNYIFCQAPEIEWQKSYGGSANDMATCIRPTTDGGFVIAGYTLSTGGNVTGHHGGNDIWIVKIDALGNLQWQKALGGSADEFAYSIQQTSDGGYIVAGSTNSNDGDVSGTHTAPLGISTDYWIVKLDATGNIQWKKSIGGPNMDIAYDIKQTSDGGYIVAGYAGLKGGDVTRNNGDFDCWVVKLNSEGVIQWDKNYGIYYGEFAHSVEPTTDGGFIIAGFADDGTGGASYGRGNYYIIKTDASGNLQWEKKFGGSLSDEAYSVKQTTDGGYIIAGFAYSRNGDITNNRGSQDCWIVKLDVSGNLQWQKSLGGGDYDDAASIQQTADGNYLIAASTNSVGGDVTGNKGQSDFWLVKIDGNGSIIWQKAMGGSRGDYAKYALQLNDGAYIIAGYSNSTDKDVSGNHGAHDYWVVKLKPAESGPLPIHLISFSGNIQNHTAKLNWQSATEDNFKEFIIEKSTDGSSFSSIATVNTKGSNSNYIFSTPQKEAVAYYRLRMVDKDGQFSHSSVVALKQNARAISLHPNPARDFINVTATTGCEAAIYNASGVLIQKIRLKDGENRIDISRFGSGAYFLVTEGKERLPFMKQ